MMVKARARSDSPMFLLWIWHKLSGHPINMLHVRKDERGKNGFIWYECRCTSDIRKAEPIPEFDNWLHVLKRLDPVPDVSNVQAQSGMVTAMPMPLVLGGGAGGSGITLHPQNGNLLTSPRDSSSLAGHYVRPASE